MQKHTTVALNEHFQGFIEEKISSGQFVSVDEVISAGLRLLEERESKLNALRTALIEGENSGAINDYSLAGLLDELDRKI